MANNVEIVEGDSTIEVIEADGILEILELVTDIEIFEAVSQGMAGVSGKYSVSAKTTNYQVVAGDDMKFLTNVGATGLVTFTFDTALNNISVGFACIENHPVKIQVPNDEAIIMGVGVTDLGGFLYTTRTGSMLIMYKISATKWLVVAHEGNWKFDTV
jgi:hypothetical protein